MGQEALNFEIFTVGKIIGLLTGTPENFSVVTSWFSDPISNIESIDERLGDIVSLAAAFFPTLDAPPALPGLDNTTWFPFTQQEGAQFCLVTSAVNGTVAGEIGLGITLPPIGDKSFNKKHIKTSTSAATISIVPYAYCPLFEFNGSSATFVPASNPVLKSGVKVKGASPFKVDSVSFTGITLDTQAFLGPADPSFTLTFDGLKGTKDGPSFTTLTSLKSTEVLAWLGQVVSQASNWLNLKPSGRTFTYGDVLAATGILTVNKSSQAPKTYTLNLSALTGTPQQIATNILFNILNTFIGSDPIVKLDGGGIYLASRTKAGTTVTTYGVRIATQVPLTKAAAAANPLTICLGSWLTGETDTDNWMLRAGSTDTGNKPGITVFLMSHDSSAGAISFAPELQMISVGLNIQGSGDASLANVNGYTLKGTELRGYYAPSGQQYGAALRLDDIGFPAAPALADSSGSKSNPVASSILSSGDSTGGDTTPVNPAFSAKAGYIHGNSPFFQAIDANGANTDTIWFPVQHRFGPINCEKIGVEIEGSASNPELGLLFDGSVNLGSLEVDLDRLTVDVVLKQANDIHSYGLDLQGLAVTFNSSDVAVSGGLVKMTSNGAIEYNGDALIQFKDIVIAALGSYTSLQDGSTSLFIFAVLNRTIGGPACFYVTGLAAGFGYNRSLTIPAQNNVQNFPLVAGLSDPSKMGGSGTDLTAALEALNQWVPPTRGEFWLAAGVQFTTFKVINTNALLAIEFGNQLTIAVLGISTLKQPSDGETYVYAELDLEFLIMPSLGEIQASAVLSSSSYVLTKDAHLTGGFAFFAWFDTNEHAGDFVFTIGGYHPAFLVPAHYPQEPRLGINWQISDGLAMVGTAYFAITPQAMMAGAAISITYHDGNLNAWLSAGVDIILYWSPFYVIDDAYISVGVSYRINLLFTHVTLSVEIGADFNLWGPPIGGEVHIDWYIISFSIGFGADQRNLDDLAWSDFSKLLPTKTPPQQSSVQALESLLSEATDPTPQPAYLSITANDGLKLSHDVGSNTIWLVRPGRFQFSIGQAVPASSYSLSNPNGPGMPLTKPVGMRRVNGGISASNYVCPTTIAVLRLTHTDSASIQSCMATPDGTVFPANCRATLADVQGWLAFPVEKNMPQSMWGETPDSGSDPDINSTSTIPASVGVTLEPEPPDFNNGTPIMSIDDVFTDRAINPGNENGLPLSQITLPVTNPPAAASTFTDLANINTESIVTIRTNVYASLQQMGYVIGTNAPLPQMQSNPGKNFADEPMEGTVVAA